MYSHTVQIDLRPNEEEIFASLHGTARRHIRSIAKRPVRICPIEDRVYAPRLGEILRETLRRTGGAHRAVDWESVIDFAKGNPALGRLVGLCSTECTGPESLLAFALGLGHGDNVQYATAGSIRRPDLRWPLGYALAWDLVIWGKSAGAEWFDFGGITEGHAFDRHDAVGGISDFKRYFTKERVSVGEEWIFEPHWLQGALSRAISAGAAWAGTLVRKLPM
jgi:lipid II:glycine glycyltransferase (peptidoglycan interpeptide bridge formation enzyme)